MSSGEKKPKDHVGPLTSYNIDTNAIESLASTWDSSSKVVWKTLGEQFVTNKRKISPSNSGQVIKKYLLSKEKEGEFHFDFKGKNEEPKKIIRKALFKVGEKVSAPLDMSSAKVHKIMKQQVQSGEIEIGGSTLPS